MDFFSSNIPIETTLNANGEVIYTVINDKLANEVSIEENYASKENNNSDNCTSINNLVNTAENLDVLRQIASNLDFAVHNNENGANSTNTNLANIDNLDSTSNLIIDSNQLTQFNLANLQAFNITQNLQNVLDVEKSQNTSSEQNFDLSSYQQNNFLISTDYATTEQLDLLNERRYLCEICLKRFKKISHLKDHIRVHTGEKPFECKFPHCNLSFSTNGSLKRHMVTHCSERPYACPYCYRAFRKPLMCETHIKSVHFNPNGTFKNDSLSKIESGLNESDSGDESSDFDDIGEAQLLNSNSSSAHTGGGSFGLIPPSLNSTSLLKKAAKIRAERIAKRRSKPYKCPQPFCNVRLSRKSTLKRHILLHAGRLPYTCQRCGKSFKTWSVKKRHYEANCQDDFDDPNIFDTFPFNEENKFNLNFPTMASQELTTLGFENYTTDAGSAHSNMLLQGCGSNLLDLNNPSLTNFSSLTIPEMMNENNNFNDNVGPNLKLEFMETAACDPSRVTVNTQSYIRSNNSLNTQIESRSKNYFTINGQHNSRTDSPQQQFNVASIMANLANDSITAPNDGSFVASYPTQTNNVGISNVIDNSFKNYQTNYDVKDNNVQVTNIENYLTEQLRQEDRSIGRVLRTISVSCDIARIIDILNDTYASWKLKDALIAARIGHVIAASSPFKSQTLINNNTKNNNNDNNSPLSISGPKVMRLVAPIINNDYNRTVLPISIGRGDLSLRLYKIPRVFTGVFDLSDLTLRSRARLDNKFEDFNINQAPKCLPYELHETSLNLLSNVPKVEFYTVPPLISTNEVPIIKIEESDFKNDSPSKRYNLKSRRNHKFIKYDPDLYEIVEPTNNSKINENHKVNDENDIGYRPNVKRANLARDLIETADDQVEESIILPMRNTKSPNGLQCHSYTKQSAIIGEDTSHIYPLNSNQKSQTRRKIGKDNMGIKTSPQSYYSSPYQKFLVVGAQNSKFIKPEAPLLTPNLHSNLTQTFSDPENDPYIKAGITDPDIIAALKADSARWRSLVDYYKANPTVAVTDSSTKNALVDMSNGSHEMHFSANLNMNSTNSDLLNMETLNYDNLNAIISMQNPEGSSNLSTSLQELSNMGFDITNLPPSTASGNSQEKNIVQDNSIDTLSANVANNLHNNSLLMHPSDQFVTPHNNSPVAPVPPMYGPVPLTSQLAASIHHATGNRKRGPSRHTPHYLLCQACGLRFGKKQRDIFIRHLAELHDIYPTANTGPITPQT